MSIALPVLVGGEALFDFIATEVGYGLGGSRTFQNAGSSIVELAQVGAEALHSVMCFANAAAAIVATRVGAAEANPSRQELAEFLAFERVRK